MTGEDECELCRQAAVGKIRRSNCGSNKDVGEWWRGTAEHAWLIRGRMCCRRCTSLTTYFAEPAADEGGHEPGCHAPCRRGTASYVKLKGKE